MQIKNNIEVFTDGSCHTQLCIGAWASVLLINDQKVCLSGVLNNTTHNRMEILAVLKALEYIVKSNISFVKITIVSDSQYVVGLLDRQSKFIKSNFKTNALNDIRNVDLVKELFNYTDKLNVEFIKIKAHQKPTDIINYNIEVDKTCRNLVRKAVSEID